MEVDLLYGIPGSEYGWLEEALDDYEDELFDI
jgi:hypothetical protein